MVRLGQSEELRLGFGAGFASGGRAFELIGLAVSIGELAIAELGAGFFSSSQLQTAPAKSTIAMNPKEACCGMAEVPYQSRVGRKIGTF